MQDALEQTVVGAVGRRHQVLSDQDGDDEGVDGNDTGHDDGDEALVWGRAALVEVSLFLFPSLSRVCQSRGHSVRTFMIRSGRKVPTPAMPMPDFAVP